MMHRSDGRFRVLSVLFTAFTRSITVVEATHGLYPASVQSTGSAFRPKQRSSSSWDDDEITLYDH
ncbi:hypothetical protein LPJ74_003314 [Coemansia sp. RSA 1843]|nr:hypothetical protein LPJ74_003314 [Coemansia sp. RSA 1843]